MRRCAKSAITTTTRDRSVRFAGTSARPCARLLLPPNQFTPFHVVTCEGGCSLKADTRVGPQDKPLRLFPPRVGPFPPVLENPPPKPLEVKLIAEPTTDHDLKVSAYGGRECV